MHVVNLSLLLYWVPPEWIEESPLLAYLSDSTSRNAGSGLAWVSGGAFPRRRVAYSACHNNAQRDFRSFSGRIHKTSTMATSNQAQAGMLLSASCRENFEPSIINVSEDQLCPVPLPRVGLEYELRPHPMAVRITLDTRGYPNPAVDTNATARRSRLILYGFNKKYSQKIITRSSVTAAIEPFHQKKDEVIVGC